MQDQSKETKTELETAAHEAESGKETSAPAAADPQAALKADKQYKKGRIIYDVGMWLMTVYLLLFVAKQLLHIDIMVGGAFISNYLYILVIIPLLMMIIGIVISDKAAKQYKVKENHKLWVYVLSALGVLVIAVSVCEILMPSYHVYRLQTLDEHNSNQVVRAGQEFVIAEYRTGTILSPAPAKKPGYLFLDVYAKYGIFVVKKASAADNNGTYEVLRREKNDSEYVLMVRSLGREETFPFSY